MDVLRVNVIERYFKIPIWVLQVNVINYKASLQNTPSGVLQVNAIERYFKLPGVFQENVIDRYFKIPVDVLQVNMIEHSFKIP